VQVPTRWRERLRSRARHRRDADPSPSPAMDSMLALAARLRPASAALPPLSPRHSWMERTSAGCAPISSHASTPNSATAPISGGELDRLANAARPVRLRRKLMRRRVAGRDRAEERKRAGVAARDRRVPPSRHPPQAASSRDGTDDSPCRKRAKMLLRIQLRSDTLQRCLQAPTTSANVGR